MVLVSKLEVCVHLTKTYVDDNDLPIRLFLIQEGHHTENLDLLDLTCVADKFTNFANVQRVIVALRFGLGVYDVGVFPGLPMSVKDAAQRLESHSLLGRHHSSTDSPCGGSSCGQIGACLS